MTSRKKLRRARRHTLGLLDEAATALDREEFALAHKLLGRAVEQGFMNPRVHVEAAALWFEMGRREVAEAAVRRALELAPGFPLALELAASIGLAVEPPARPPIGEVSEFASPPVRTERSASFDAATALDELQRDGIAVLERFLTHGEASALARRGGDDPAWLSWRALASSVGTLGRGVLRPAAVDWLDAAQAELFACAREAGQALATALRAPLAYPAACPLPPAHVERAVCLSSHAGAGYPRRRDLGDRACLPLRGLACSGPGPVEVVLHDLRPGKPRQRARVVPPGAAVLFACRERPVAVAGVLGLQPIEWELRAVGAESWSGLLFDWTDVRGG